MDIFYYSNYCKHSQRVLQFLVKGGLVDKISFICIDKRFFDKKPTRPEFPWKTAKRLFCLPTFTAFPRCSWSTKITNWFSATIL